MPQRGGAAKATTDHDFIRHWVEERGGCPASVKRTRGQRGPGIIRIDFPGYSGKQSLTQISWDEFFDQFEKRNLSFLYQERTATGRQSRFSKLVGRDSVQARAEHGTRSARRGGSSARSASTRTARRGTAGTAQRKRAPAKRKASTGRRRTTRTDSAR